MARSRRSPSSSSGSRSSGGTSTRRRSTRRRKTSPPKLTNLETKLAEVIGLAMAAKDAGDRVVKMTNNRELTQTLKRMRAEADQTEKDSSQVASSFQGKKSAIMQEARTARKKAQGMMRDYLDRKSDALDGFEFLTMAEAGEVGHWSVLAEMAKNAGNRDVQRLVRTYLPIQKRHLRDAQEGSLVLARAENPTGESS
jgi:hypothetical protein